MASDNDGFLDLMAAGNTLEGVSRLLGGGEGREGRLGLNRAMYGAVSEADLEQVRAEESRHLERLSGQEPREQATTLYNLGCFALVQDDILTARMRFEEAARLEPDNLLARHNLAYAQDLLAETEQARQGYEAIVADNPALVLSRLNLAQLRLQEGDDAGGLAELEALHADMPDNAGVLLYLCRGLLTRAGAADVERVVALLADSALTGQYLDLQECLAYAQYLLGDPDRAEANFRQLLEANPDNLFARMGMIKLLAQRGAQRELVEHAEHCQRQNPDEKVAHLLELLQGGPAEG